MGIHVDLNDRDILIQNCVTCLSSKVVSQNSDILAPMAVDAVLRIIDKEKDTNVDLKKQIDMYLLFLIMVKQLPLLQFLIPIPIKTIKKQYFGERKMRNFDRRKLNSIAGNIT